MEAVLPRGEFRVPCWLCCFNTCKISRIKLPRAKYGSSSTCSRDIDIAVLLPHDLLHQLWKCEMLHDTLGTEEELSDFWRRNSDLAADILPSFQAP